MQLNRGHQTLFGRHGRTIFLFIGCSTCGLLHKSCCFGPYSRANKKNFYQLAQRGHFQNGPFDTYPSQVPLATVTVEFFLVRPVPQWREYLAWHGVELFDLPLNMNFQQLSDFHDIGLSVQPSLDIWVFVLCTIVNFLSSAHRSDACLKFLSNEMFESTSFNIEHFRITPLDANLLIQHAFSSTPYPVDQLTDNTGNLLLHWES